MRFLLDENISPETADILTNKGHDVLAIIDSEYRGIADEEVVNLAQREGRIIVTQDLDFGDIYFFSAHGELGIIVLRKKGIQTVESINAMLSKFLDSNELKELGEERLLCSLVIVDDKKIRILTK